MNRLEKVLSAGYIPIFFAAPVTEDFKELLLSRNQSDNISTSLDLIKMAKELIFNVIDGIPIFHQIVPLFDTEKLEIKYDHVLDIFFDPEDEVELTNDILKTLGLATALEVPIYPNTLELEQELARYYELLIEKGFSAPGENGVEVRLLPKNAVNIKDLEPNQIAYLDLTRMWSSGEIALIKSRVQGELIKLERANRTLSSLDTAIQELSGLISLKHRNENAIQKCLTKNPILFGLEYKKIIPKHKLGDDYETDYVLEKWDGVIDVVEIEPSSFKLFNKNGDPSNKLTHSEQQVINWLNLIENNGSYARAKLPNLSSPKAFVIIGLEENLTELDKKNLMLRNKLFGGRVVIMTYSDLVNRARLIKDRLDAGV